MKWQVLAVFAGLALVCAPVAASDREDPAALDGVAIDEVVEEDDGEEDALSFDQRRAVELLGEASRHFDELTELPESRWLRRDQQSAREDIDDLIDDALEVMDVPEIVSMRRQYRELEDRIMTEQERRADLREERMFAPDTDASTLARFTPTETLREMTARTRGDFDRLIEARERNIAAYEEDLEALKGDMAAALEDVGLSMPPDQLELWMSSAIGDDVVSMAVVFRSIRTLTQRLEELTRESGENLNVAGRYYGMVVILHRLVVTMQERFVERVDGEIVPRLEAYREEADEIIAQSRELIREGGHRDSLESNIAANELTRQAIDLYLEVVTGQREQVAEALEISRYEKQVAVNTYRTVQLSANVADLIRDGLDTFETLSELQVPETAEFRNDKIREEFRRLTERLER
ncbi:hypothetical protein D893_02102 [Thioalkalivibrio sp. ALE21]|uniref:hypothetical protein n=1 Tax=Thioalkalivibrio sp. ALE21 TaxID=1158175 RepID=UPI000D9F59CB|nr:hypothetical protein [Thioalkalivibrio sp. ALE21]PYG01270.1 hypothetical protein D893_02102 [Thioalkalivibrio sp. ALE21]